MGNRACRTRRLCWDPGLFTDEQWEQRELRQEGTASNQCLGKITRAAREGVDREARRLLAVLQMKKARGGREESLAGDPLVRDLV